MASTPAPIDAPVLHERDGNLSLCFADAAVQSRMLEADPVALVLEYTRLMMGFLLLQPEPARIAMIGLGGGSLAKYCALRLPDAEFTAVEISPEVIALRELFGIPPDGARFRVLCDDGAAFIRRDGEPLDVLLVDGFDHHGQPEQLCTPAFYDACRARLSPAGVLGVNLYAEEIVCDERIDRIRRSFGGKVIVVDADGSDNRVVFAAAGGPLPPPFGVLVQRVRALRASHPVGLEATARKIARSSDPRRTPRTHAQRRRAGRLAIGRGSAAP